MNHLHAVFYLTNWPSLLLNYLKKKRELNNQCGCGGERLCSEKQRCIWRRAVRISNPVLSFLTKKKSSGNFFGENKKQTIFYIWTKKNLTWKHWERHVLVLNCLTWVYFFYHALYWLRRKSVSVIVSGKRTRVCDFPRWARITCGRAQRHVFLLVWTFLSNKKKKNSKAASHTRRLHFRYWYEEEIIVDWNHWIKRSETGWRKRKGGLGCWGEERVMSGR